ncbi:deoxyguanosinetriphosphate triphosphohydrolase-like protein [Brevibacillus formosus]|uniref:Deoxyguanosinetriphosphate triphosphohydrolase-like protein n=3 Tax=Brevibacillus formosus TaxID=54913 RepID=A0ABQ0T1A8_9BACL|nr:deoxyguanosinetriphosphate triphosphohydrolase-like protein [Brevibacillus formosus]
MSRMEWRKLLNGNRIRKSETLYVKKQRNEFDKDYERIIYSSSLRRLQDKAQVFPLQENDFTRTRLTHSLEVASLGQSIAWEIGIWLLEEKKIFKDFWQAKELASLVEVTCLVHDLGNPPFGHYGEDIIRSWFQNWFESDTFKEIQKKYIDNGDVPLNNQQMNDFKFFEGNAQAIRILSKLQFLNDEYGANFTLGSLATLMKYPWSSDHEYATSKKKFGYFYSERELFEKLKKEVGIGEQRHPATYLLEAADDIAYLTADIEDGVKKRAVPWEEIYSGTIKKFFGDNYPDHFTKLEEHRLKAIKNKVPNRELVGVQNFKVMAQGIMIEAVIDSFKENYESIMEGSFKGDLLENSSAKQLKEELVNISIEYCYKNTEVLTLELVGDRVLNELLNFFVDAVVKIDKKPKAKLREEKILHLVSANFRHIQTLKEGGPKIEINELSLYMRLLLVTDFISGMTDSYAVNLHQQLSGIKLP